MTKQSKGSLVKIIQDELKAGGFGQNLYIDTKRGGRVPIDLGGLNKDELVDVITCIRNGDGLMVGVSPANEGKPSTVLVVEPRWHEILGFTAEGLPFSKKEVEKW